MFLYGERFGRKDFFEMFVRDFRAVLQVAVANSTVRRYIDSTSRYIRYVFSLQVFAIMVNDLNKRYSVFSLLVQIRVIFLVLSKLWLNMISLQIERQTISAQPFMVVQFYSLWRKIACKLRRQQANDDCDDCSAQSIWFTIEIDRKTFHFIVVQIQKFAMRIRNV